MTIKVEHVTRLTCDCGDVVEVPSKPDWGETELGSQYASIGYDRPKDWSYDHCPACTGVPVDTKVTVQVLTSEGDIAVSPIYSVKMRAVDQVNKKYDIRCRLDVVKQVFLDLPDDAYVAAVLRVSAASIARDIYARARAEREQM